jgi:AraC family transcriptional regulator
MFEGLLKKGVYSGEAIRHFELSNNLITVTQYSANKNMPEWHSHNTIHFCLVFNNGRADTRNSVSYARPDGSVFAYHAGQIHRWISPDSNSNAINVALDSQFLAQHGLVESAVVDAITTNPVAKVIIVRLFHAIQEQSNLTKEEALTELLYLVNKPDCNQYAVAPAWLHRAYDFVMDNWETTFSLQQVAAAADVHHVTVATYFPRYVGVSPHNLQKRLRLDKAIRLMGYEKRRFSDIAHDCGFADQSHFIRSCKQIMGCVPRQLSKFMHGH